MNSDEIASEILKDYDIVKKSFERLVTEYDRERKHLKIDKNDTYSKWYKIKSKKKNDWLINIQKAPAVEKYKNSKSVNLAVFIYYYNSMGLRVFAVTLKGDIIVYNGHLFTRYNERMGLEIENSLEIVKHFFNENGYNSGQPIIKDKRTFVISVCKDGLLLGEIQEGKWVVQKTFITKDLKRPDQDEIEQDIINCLRADIEIAINSDILKINT